MNLSFSKLGQYGRLGNNFFQIIGVLGQAEKYGAKAYFPEWPYDQYFEQPMPHGPMQSYQIKEAFYNFHDWQLDPGQDYDLLGFFQSEKYFPKENPFIFKKSFLEQVKEMVPRTLFDKEVILLQVRRTDYVKNPNYYQLPVTYYIQALIEHFPNWRDCNIAFVSDDIPYCKVHFQCLPNAYFFEGSDIEQIAFQSMCDHFIIANSSFGWWGAWLSEQQHNHTKIVHPGRLQAGPLLAKNPDESDYYPERWVNFKKDQYKIDLADCTFTIPVYYDHRDRQQNLDLSVCMIQTDFNTNIIVGEQGGHKFEYMGKFCKYHNFEGMANFHRTKMLNDMAVMAETPYIANWDADVIIPPMQIYMTLLKLREGMDMVFPYDGRFARLSRYPFFQEIERLLDIGAIGDEEPKGRRGKPVPESSVGGAVFFNKESFVDGGMENEYMISFGPEDCERNDRFNILDYKVGRACELGTDLGGCLYHINHFIGPNSSNQNMFFEANKQERDKVKAMDRTQLIQYVDTWPWRHKYTESYYRRISEGAIQSAKEVYKELRNLFDFRDIIDIGCGVGEWSKDIEIYTGIDYKIPTKYLLITPEQYYNCDLEKETLRDSKYPSTFFSNKFDLCLCLEVAEHIIETRADILIEMLCSLSDKVLFSAAIPYQGGTGHKNEQWQTYWADKFYENGFMPSANQPDIRDNEKIELWYRQNIVLYEKIIQGGNYSTLEDYVHPEYYLEIVKNLINIKSCIQ